MSGQNVIDPADERDRDWLCELLDQPARAVEIADRDGGELEAGTRCEYLAVLGLMAQTLEPVDASPGLERRILAAATAETDARAQRSPVSPASLLEHRAAARRRWLLPLAATLAMAAVGLSAWQARRLGELRSVVTAQAEELAAMREVADRLARMEGENAAQSAALSLLTGAGAEFCPLRPPPASPAPEAWGALAMSEDGAHWYLRVVGLEPPDDRREYRLWFLQDGEPIDGAVLPAPGGGGPLELMNGRTPEGFNAVVITLEPAGSDRPTGSRLLFGNERMRLL